MNYHRCTENGQGSCKRCEEKGKWNRVWMCLLYKIEELEGCYCWDCVKEIIEENRTKGDISRKEQTMKKFKITVPCDYVQGHLRYGHGEAIVKAETEEEAKEIAKEWDDFDVVVDDYEIEDHDSWNFDEMTVEEITEE